MRLCVTILFCLIGIIETHGSASLQNYPSSVSADFKQTKTSSLYKGEKVSYGHFVYKNPDYVKWEYTSPAKQCWETSAKKQNNNPMFAAIVGVIKDCMSGNFDSNRKFSILKKQNILTLTPVDKNIGHVILKIEIKLDTKDELPEVVTIYEKKGGCTVITFSNVQR